MTWFTLSASHTSDVLFRLMLSAMNMPTAARPRHCLRSVSSCMPRRLGASITGSSARKLKAMWQLVRSSGNEKP